MAQTNDFLHLVFFWLKADTTDVQREAFLAALEGLEVIEGIKYLSCGVPGQTPRAVVDNSYDYCSIVNFVSKEAHDAYQTHPLHEAFLAQFKPIWEKVLVYDMIIQ